MAYNDAKYLLSRVRVARGYDDYIPHEYDGQPEKEKFNSVLDDIEKTLFMMDPDDLEELQEETNLYEWRDDS